MKCVDGCLSKPAARVDLAFCRAKRIRPQSPFEEIAVSIAVRIAVVFVKDFFSLYLGQPPVTGEQSVGESVHDVRVGRPSAEKAFHTLRLGSTTVKLRLRFGWNKKGVAWRIKSQVTVPLFLGMILLPLKT